jgi:hypothetical protein
MILGNCVSPNKQTLAFGAQRTHSILLAGSNLPRAPIDDQGHPQGIERDDPWISAE